MDSYQDTHQLFSQMYAQPNNYYSQHLPPEFLDYLENQSCKYWQVLDIGAGEGRYTLYFARRQAWVTAVELVRAGLDKIKHAANQQNIAGYISLIKSNITNYQFPANHFDCIIAATVLDHLTQLDRQQVVTDIQQSLKPGGLLYAEAFTVDDPGFQQSIEKNVDHQLSTSNSTNFNGVKSAVSETISAVKHFFYSNELRTLFSQLEILQYQELMKPDTSHGAPHSHGWAILLARKPFC